MKQFKLDRSQAAQLRISNDAFYYLLEEEPPLDEANIAEAQEILSAYPNGFIIDNDYKLIEGAGLIEATFVPYVIDDVAEYDAYYELTSNMLMRIKWIEHNRVRAWWHNTDTGATELRGDYEVYVNKHGLQCFHTGPQDGAFATGKCSLFFLKHFKKKQA